MRDGRRYECKEKCLKGLLTCVSLQMFSTIREFHDMKLAAVGAAPTAAADDAEVSETHNKYTRTPECRIWPHKHDMDMSAMFV